MIRTATATDLEMMLNWAATEGWNPGRDDAVPFFTADPSGFFVAEREGQPVACISVVNHAPDFASLGFYICHPDWRGQGIGYALWTHALDHAGTRCVGLDGVAAQEANYARSGFVRVGATTRLEGGRRALPQATGHAEPQNISPATDDDLPALVGLDHSAFGIARVAFMRAWLLGSGTRKTVVMRDGATIVGFATARLCRNGTKIGPIVAANAEAALRLAASAADEFGTQPVIIDVPDTQSDTQTALRAAGFCETFATARMYRGTPPVGDGTGQAIATMELG